jgi:CotS family spore coat protein
LLELMRQANREYAIGAISIETFHSIWKLNAPNQAFILKKLRMDTVRFSQLAEIINEYQQEGFHDLIPILKTQRDTFFMEYSGCFYSLSPWHPGEKPSFGNPSHLKTIAQCFGKLHAASQTLIFPQSLINHQGIGEYQINLNFLESLQPGLLSRKNKNRIDRAVMDKIPYYLQQGRCSLHGLNAVRNLWPLLGNESGFCHNDPAPGNIIIHDKRCFLIDFEFSNRDLFIKEFVLLVLRALQATEWQQRTFEILLEAYQEERPLTALERSMLPYLLLFPRRFWRFCFQRYREGLNWTEKRFQSRLREIIQEEPKRRRFLQSWQPELDISEES